jgi:hypothetical protein
MPDVWRQDFCQELNDAVAALKRVIVVPGTSTQYANRQGKVLAFHLEVPASALNGLNNTTYFMSEQVRTEQSQYNDFVGVSERVRMFF